MHETLRDVAEGKGKRRGRGAGGSKGNVKLSSPWKMNVFDRTEAVGE